MRKLIPLTLCLAVFSLPARIMAQPSAPMTAATAAATTTATMQNLPPGQKRVSPHETISATIGARNTPTRVTITYGRPYSKDSKTGEIRKIWGSLVHYGEADRMGSDEATLLLTQSPMVIGDVTIPAGAYTLYIIASESGAKLAFSSNLGKWGIPVDETKDVARFDLKKAPLSPQVDELTLAIEKDAATGGGVIKIMWETTQFSLPFTLKT